MRSFFRDIAFTLLFVCVLCAALEVAIGRTLTEHSYKDWYMKEKADQIKTLVLGNSLFSNSFDPHALGDSVFDGAIYARELYYDSQIIKKYAPKMSNLRTILVPLTVCQPIRLATDHDFRYARYMGMPYKNNPVHYSALLSGQLVYKSLVPIKVSSQITPERSAGYIDSIGYAPVFRVYDGHTLCIPVWTFEEIIQDREYLINQITEMAKDCNNLGVRLICILPPSADVYLNRVDPRLYDSIEAIIPRLSKTLHFDYKFYHNDPEFRADSLYHDELHLNYWGAKLFAERVKRDFGL